VLERAADAWSDKAGGTSGALWGVILTSVAARVGDHGSPTGADIAAGIAAAAAGVMAYGKAEVGDKTLVDALVPFRDELTSAIEAGSSLADAWRGAADAATQAAASTERLLPRMGRARAHGQNSVGTPDPGAVSLALIVTAVGDVLAAADERN
jgi:dihydroxyacetone kinase